MHPTRENRPADETATRTKLMALEIRNAYREKGYVTRRDLTDMGFTPAEIDRLGEKALGLAIDIERAGISGTADPAGGGI